jgi:hypothetical protein
MCGLAEVSRASYYRHLVVVAPDEEKMTVRQAIQEVALAHHRCYGYRRVTAELHRRHSAGLRQNSGCSGREILHSPGPGEIDERITRQHDTPCGDVKCPSSLYR